jgi:hypothetical protein
MANINISYDPTKNPKQELFHKLCSQYHEILYVGGRRSGKTVAACMQAYYLSIRYPGNIGLIARAHYSDLGDTILASWKRLIPIECYTINEQKHIITVHNGTATPSIIYYRGFDTTERINKSRGFECGWFLIDQAEECNESDISELLPCLSLVIVQGAEVIKPKWTAIYLANPMRRYIVNKFMNQRDDRMVILQTSTYDNIRNLPDGYINDLERQYRNDPKGREAMIMGSLEIADMPDTIIPYEKVTSAFNKSKAIPLAYFDKKIIVIDLARFGDDLTQIFGFEGLMCVDEIHYGKKDLDYTGARAVSMQRQIGANCIIWDADGLGAGMMAILKPLVEKGTTLIEFHGSAKAENEMYYNTRAEAWCEARDAFGDGLVTVSPKVAMMTELQSQLTTICLDYKNGKVIAESKDDIKKKIGRSPDHADAFVYGIWGLKRAPSLYIEPVIKKGSMRELISEIDEQQKLDGLLEEEIPGNWQANKW